MSAIAIIGKPNSGKSLLFNKMTGLSQKVANFPGVTVEVKEGKYGEHTLIDLPGIYTFNALTQDEEVAVKKFFDHLATHKVGAVLCVLDSTSLKASLRLGLEVQMAAAKEKVPVIFALNMMDVLEDNQLRMDVDGLAKELRAPVIPISAKTGNGIEPLKHILENSQNLKPIDFSEINFELRAAEIQKSFGVNADVLIKKQTRLDQILLSNIYGGFFFVVIMLVLFQAIFTWAVPFMDLVEWLIEVIGMKAASYLPKGWLQDFVIEAIFGGLGSFLVFVPQIFFLTFIVGLLEDSGYLARAAIICHKPLKFFGLSGKSFIPLLSGHACAIPAIYASRVVESPKRRLLTVLAIPLMGCSARLPVYTLLIAAFIPAYSFLGGLIGLQGIIFFSLYFLGIIVALIVSGVLSKTLYKTKNDSPFILELPPYRLPHWRPLLKRSLNSCHQFIQKAGLVIFCVTIIVWTLGYFPNGSGHLESSWLAIMGRFIEPVMTPLGLDWKYGIAVLSSFVAREVFVGTLGTLFGIEAIGDDISNLASQIQNSGLTLGSGMALLVFYVIALQCVSTLVIIRRELNSTKTAISLFFSYGALAYFLAWCVKLLIP
ncbi:MAG: ferrous iron transporter B [Bdellovibrionaceae bacterium]|nr:ferrous iron transporter B [Pseudobdellovibrionaceae bacterium]